MSTSQNAPTTLADLERERARQDRALEDVAEQLRSYGDQTVVVSRQALEAIDQACLSRISTHNLTAVRG